VSARSEEVHIAYPVALSFTRGEPLREKSLVEIYATGLKQVPVIGRIFAAQAGSPRIKNADPPPVNDPKAVPKDGKD